MAGEADALLLLILAFIFPPAAVAFIAGCGADLCFNILLTILGWLPGCIHAFWLVFKRAEANETYGYQNWTYTGMGEYQPRGAGTQSAGATGSGPPQPPPGQYSATPAPPPAGEAQAPVDQKGYTAPLPPPPPPPAATDSKSGDYPATDQRPAPPTSAPTDQVPSDQKQQADPQSAPPPSGA